MLNRRIAGRRMKRVTMYLIIVLGVGAIMGYLGLQMYILGLEDRLRLLQVQREDASRRIVILETRAAEMRRGSRIQRIAVNELGMKLPEGAPALLY
jgi:cell division protein FtsL